MSRPSCFAHGGRPTKRDSDISHFACGARGTCNELSSPRSLLHESPTEAPKSNETSNSNNIHFTNSNSKEDNSKLGNSFDNSNSNGNNRSSSNSNSKDNGYGKAIKVVLVTVIVIVTVMLVVIQ